MRRGRAVSSSSQRSTVTRDSVAQRRRLDPSRATTPYALARQRPEVHADYDAEELHAVCIIQAGVRALFAFREVWANGTLEERLATKVVQRVWRGREGRAVYARELVRREHRMATRIQAAKV